MFDGPDFPKSLDEDVFERWLEEGRQSKLSYSHLLIVWDELESEYQPVYVEGREQLADYAERETPARHESLVAAYDLYSETRIV